MPIRLIQSLALFGKELIDNPREMGSACPSSPQLARRIARLVARENGGYVLELGAGTGAITHALLRAGVAPDRLLPVERSARLVAHLRRRFPQLNIIHGDARRLRGIADALPAPARHGITHVVSSLPLRSLAPADVEQIFNGVRAVLGADGLYIQYTYALSRGTSPTQGLHWCGRAVVWLNLPPARVDVFATARETALAFRQSELHTSFTNGTVPAWSFGDSDVAC